MFTSCDPADTGTNMADTFAYNCTCSYGACEYVFTRIEYANAADVGCHQLCEVEITVVNA